MAVLDEVPGIQVAVQINGRDAVEYDDPEPPSHDHATCPISSKYIECIDDAEFSIRCVANRDYNWGYKKHGLECRILWTNKI